MSDVKLVIMHQESEALKIFDIIWCIAFGNSGVTIWLITNKSRESTFLAVRKVVVAVAGELVYIMLLVSTLAFIIKSACNSEIIWVY